MLVIVKARTLYAVCKVLVAISMLCQEHNLVIDPVFTSVGAVTPNGVMLACKNRATLFLFNTAILPAKLREAEEAKEIAYQNSFIYSLLNDAKEIFAEQYLHCKESQLIYGQAAVRTVFKVDGDKAIARLRVKGDVLYKDRCKRTGTSSRYWILQN